jgi:hypothetical protein
VSKRKASQRAVSNMVLAPSCFAEFKCITKILFVHDNNEKFWEEAIAYFPLIQHGEHRKRKQNWGIHRQQDDLMSHKGGYIDVIEHKQKVIP